MTWVWFGRAKSCSSFRSDAGALLTPLGWVHVVQAVRRPPVSIYLSVRARGNESQIEMSIELIRGELERLYSLEEMMDLSSRLLGFEPREVGGTASTASFARALTDHCQQRDAVAALIDAVQGTKGDAAPQLGKLVTRCCARRWI